MRKLKARRAVLLAVLALVPALLVWKPNAVVGLITRPFGVNLDVGASGAISPTVPDGFTTNIFAEGLHGPRLMATGPDGTIYVAEQDGGKVTAMLDKDGDGKADSVTTIADGLDGPNSVFFYSGTLIVGEHSQVSQITLGPDGKAASRKVLVPNLPNDGVHHTKTALVGPDGKLYVAMGSTCNVCDESDARRAAVSVYNLDGSAGRTFTKGMRNAVGLSLNPWTNQIWASNNGRDLMGDDTPPETIDILSDGIDFGWPRCHAGDIVDPQFGGSQGCGGVTPPAVKMQAHMAPLGIVFYHAGNFPAPYNSSLYVALHGSWNRSTKVGYRVMRVPLIDGKVAGEAVDFATGWLGSDGGVSGRPAGVAVGLDGSLLISDDKGGYIYRVSVKK